MMFMPLLMADPGKANVIRRIGGMEKTKQFLKSLGFVVGGDVTVISQIDGNLIVKVKESRVAINKDLAGKIFI